MLGLPWSLVLQAVGRRLCFRPVLPSSQTVRSRHALLLGLVPAQLPRQDDVAEEVVAQRHSDREDVASCTGEAQASEIQCVLPLWRRKR